MIIEVEAVGGHAYNDRLRVADELVAILAQGLVRMNVARPDHRQGAIRATHRDGFDALDDVGQSHARREVHAGDARFATKTGIAPIVRVWRELFAYFRFDNGRGAVYVFIVW